MLHLICRIYVDMVVNHMCAIDGTSGTGSGGSFYDTSTLTFPHYSEDDFNCCQAYDEGNCLNGAQCDTSSCGNDDYYCDAGVAIWGEGRLGFAL